MKAKIKGELSPKVILMVLGAAVALISTDGATHVWGQAVQVDQSAVDELKAFVAERKAALSALKTFEARGTIRIVTSDDYAKVVGGDKIGWRKFRILGAGAAIREELEYLDQSGTVVDRRTYYLNANQMVEVDDQAGPLATIFQLGKEDNVGLFNICPTFLEYSFLGTGITRAGIPALLPADLVSRDKWMNAISDVQGRVTEKDGTITALFGKTGPSSSLEIKRMGELDKQFRIKGVSFFAKDRMLDRKIEVLEFMEDKTFGAVGSKFRVNVYRSGIVDAPPCVTWQYEIEEFKVNPKIDEEALVFDPVSVALIYDAENDTVLKVPK